MREIACMCDRHMTLGPSAWTITQAGNKKNRERVRDNEKGGVMGMVLNKIIIKQWILTPI